MNKIKAFFLKLKSNNILKIILYWFLIVFLGLYVFSIPSFSGRPKLYLISYALMAMLGLFTILYTAIYRSFKFNKLIFVPVLFVAYSLIGTLVFSHQFRNWITLVLMSVTMFIFYYAFLAIENKRRVFRIITYAFIGFGLYFIFHYRSDFLHLNLSFLRLGDDFDNLNTIGFYYSIAFSFSFYLALFFKKKIELLFLIPAIVFFGLGLLTGSRAFIVVVAVAVIITLFIRIRKRKWILIIALLAMAGLFFVLINLPMLSFLKDQFERTIFTLFGLGDSKTDTSVVQRMVYPMNAWFLAGKNMIIGYGCNGFAIYSGIGTYAHNNYAEVICNFGVIGFFFHYFALMLPILCAFKHKENENKIVYVLIGIYLVRNLFGVTYYAKDAYLVLGVCYYLINDFRLENIFKRLALSYCEVSI